MVGKCFAKQSSFDLLPRIVCFLDEKGRTVESDLSSLKEKLSRQLLDYSIFGFSFQLLSF